MIAGATAGGAGQKTKSLCTTGGQISLAAISGVLLPDLMSSLIENLLKEGQGVKSPPQRACFFRTSALRRDRND
jgi:hypothetical protein